MAKKVLSIVESAYRATVEEQDDTILWMNHILKNAGLDITLVLRSNAVNYAVKGQDASGLTFGKLKVSHPPKLDKDLESLLEAGVPVYYVREDAEERGIPQKQLIDGIKAVSAKELPSMLDGFDSIWHW